MSRVKSAFLYILALIVLLAPAIILGWIGLTLLGWWGLILGILVGLAIFVASVNKIASQEEAESESESESEEAEAATAQVLPDATATQALKE